MTQTLAVIDYGSGNLRSAAKALERAAAEAALPIRVSVTALPEEVEQADRVVLPGVGAFAACMQGLNAIDGMVDALTAAVFKRGRPFLGVCVGMQLLATRGMEHGVHTGLNWIEGDVVRLQPQDPALKVPHMGWNGLNIVRTHPTLLEQASDSAEIEKNVYFVHSYRFAVTNSSDLIAGTHHGEPIAAIIGRDNILGFQFHPEKSQAEGLKLLTNFLKWMP